MLAKPSRVKHCRKCEVSDFIAFSDAVKMHENISSGCYAMPPMELGAKVPVSVPAANQFDPVLFCREKCKSQNQFFVLFKSQTKCQCVPKVPLGGKFLFRIRTIKNKQAIPFIFHFS